MKCETTGHGVNDYGKKRGGETAGWCDPDGHAPATLTVMVPNVKSCAFWETCFPLLLCVKLLGHKCISADYTVRINHTREMLSVLVALLHSGDPCWNCQENPLIVSSGPSKIPRWCKSHEGVSSQHHFMNCVFDVHCSYSAALEGRGHRLQEKETQGSWVSVQHTVLPEAVVSLNILSLIMKITDY